MTPAPNWRDSPAAPPGPAAGPGPAWRAPPTPAPYRVRWWKLGAVSALLLAALAGTTWAALWLRPPAPARVFVLEAGYETNLAVPHNAPGRAAGRELLALTKPAAGSWYSPRARLRGAADPVRLTRGNLSSVLTDLPAARERTVLVYVAAHGGRDSDGGYLLADDSTPDHAHRLRLEAVIDRLAALPAGTHKFLVLDCTQAPAAPEVGSLHNDFASALDMLEPRIVQVPNLLVLSASGVDQRSWVAPEWGVSAFARYFLDGLAGASDPDGDRRLTAWEVAEYVRPRVAAWARDHRGALQTPVLLPRGGEGELRARATHLTLADRLGKPPEPAPPPVFEPPPPVEESWAEYRALAGRYPPPTAYSPHLWRQYEAWVLRYEQLVLAGSPEAGVARTKAADLRRAIESAGRLDVAPQTLALPALVAGDPPRPPSREVRDAVGRVAEATDADRPKRMDDLRAATGPLDPAAAGVLWGRALLEWVAVDPPTRLPAVPAAIPPLTVGMSFRPAEVHFLLMLARDLPPPAKAAAVAPLVRRLLQLRLAAERPPAADGYPFAERTGPWVEARIAAADALRRPAEDLAFATDDRHWAEARGLAEKASAAYDTAATEAAEIARAVRSWHRAAAVLPGLADWIAAHPRADTLPDRMTRDDELKAVRAAWDDVHRLAALCANPPPADPAAAAKARAELTAAADAVDRQLAALDARLATQTANLLAVRPEANAAVESRADAVRWWQSAEAGLSAPPPGSVPPADRAKLLREWRRVSRELHVAGLTKPEPLPEPPPALATEIAFETARRTGLLRLSRLGRANASALLPDAGPDAFPQVDFRLSRFAFQADGRESLARAGDELAAAFAGIVSAANGPDLPAADRLVRLMMPGSAARLEGNPAQALRRRQAERVLFALAGRTLADHWHGDGPYYRLAVERLHADARAVGGPAKDFDALRDRAGADEPFPVQPASVEKVVLTDEPDAAIRFALARPAGVSGRPGFVVFHGTAPFPGDPAKPPPPREVRATDPAVSASEIATTIRPPAGPPPLVPVVQAGTLTFDGYYRGRRLPTAVPVERHPIPDRTAVRTPTPATATLAVRADPRLQARFGVASGSVAFVLDSSGSMRPNPKVPGDRGRFGTAADTLEKLVRGLPSGTTVGVWSFGRRTGTGGAPETTIEQVTEPTTLDRDAETVAAGIANRVRAELEPWDLSPVARAVLTARAAVAKMPGPFRAVVLISDAVDNRFADDPANAKRLSVREAVRAGFADSGISLVVVALPVSDKEEATAQAEWKVAAELTPPGLFVPPPQADEVLNWLRRGLSPRVRYRVEPARPGVPAFDLTAGEPGADNWFPGRVPPGEYDVRVSAGRDRVQRVAVGRGDRLLLDLSADRGELEVVRNFYAATAPAVARTGPDDPPADWKLSLLQNQLTEGGGVRMLAAVEDRPRPAVVSAARVGEAWFALTPVGGGGQRFAARWVREPGYPAPAWSFGVPRWPSAAAGKGAAPPVLEAWWHPDGEFPAAGRWTAPAGGAVGVRNVPAAAGDTPVTLLSVAVEEHAVEVRPGELAERVCVAVRVAYPAEKPVWVRPLGLAAAGSEVRLFEKAGRATCLFWGPSDPAAVPAWAAALTGFELVSLPAAESLAVRNKWYLKLSPIPEPSPASPRPQPPVDPR